MSWPGSKGGCTLACFKVPHLAVWALERLYCSVKWNLTCLKFSQRELLGDNDLERLLWPRLKVWASGAHQELSNALWVSLLRFLSPMMGLVFSSTLLEYLGGNIHLSLLDGWRTHTICYCGKNSCVLYPWDLVCFGCFRLPEVGYRLYNKYQLLKLCCC